MSEEIVGQLATLPPNQWAQALERLSVVDGYLRLPTPNSVDVDRCAAQLQIGPRSFFRLAAAVRELRAGTPPRLSQQGLHSHLHPRTQMLIEQVCVDLGPAARDSEILAECRRRSAGASIPAPSMSAVRTRTSKPPANPNLTTRLGRDADLILDSSALDLPVKSGDGRAVLATLTTLIHMSSGQLLGSHVSAGDPGVATVAATLLDALEPEAGLGGYQVSSPSLIVTGDLRHLQPAIERVVGAGGLVLDSQLSQGLRAGAAITAALGRRIGRIPIAPLRRRTADAGLAVPLEYASAVAAHLLTQRNRRVNGDRRVQLPDLLGPRRSGGLRRAALQSLKEGA